MKLKSLWFGVLLLAGCAPTQSRTSALTLRLPGTMSAPGISALGVSALGSKTLPPLAYQEVTITPNTPECASSAFEMPGQGWNIGLTGGGISLWAGQYGAAARPPTAEALYGLTPPQTDVSQPYEVKLFILDHFAPVNLLLRETSQSAPIEVSMVHGALVEAHLRAILESAGYVYDSLDTSGGLVYRSGQRTIRLQRVALDSASLSGTKGSPFAPHPPATGQQIRDTLQNNPAFKEFLLGSKDIAAVPTSSVLNMSFSMLPCEIMQHYRAQRDARVSASMPTRYTLNQYLVDLAAFNKLPVADLQQGLTEVSPGEPLMKYLSSVLSQRQNRKVLAVASSGNYGLTFATAPGAAPNVLSVGATTWDGTPLNWSDAADVDAVGEWYTLSAEQLTRFCREGGTCIASDVLNHTARYSNFAYRGTSFAAPTVSAYLALTLGDRNACFDTSDLGYAGAGKANGMKLSELVGSCGK